MSADFPPGQGSAADIPWPVLDRYLAGEGTVAEREVVDAWVRAHPGGEVELERLRSVLAYPQRYPEPSDLDRVWREVRLRRGAPSTTRSHQATLPATQPGPRPRGVGRGSRALRVRPIVYSAVAVVVATIAGVTGWRVTGGHPAPQAFRELTTVAGSRATVTLRDGTRFVLGPSSRLRVPEDFGRVARTVELDGEGYFAVAHNRERPFTIRTLYTVIRDVGTTFDVRAYREDGEARVAVVEGEVMVTGVGAVRERPLGRGDVATISRSAVAMRHLDDVSALTAWTQGRLVFKNAPLGDVVRQVARVFDLDITVADSGLAGQPVTAAFAGESVDVVLDNVTAVVGARYERTGSRVVIRKRASRAGRHAPSVPAVLTTAQARGAEE